MKATSAGQLRALTADTVPDTEEIRPGIWAVPLTIPHGRIRYILTYLILDNRDDVHIIDAGWDSDLNLATLSDALSDIGRAVTDISSVTVTHMHPDHIGMASRLRDYSGAEIRIGRNEQQAMSLMAEGVEPTLTPAQLEMWGVPGHRQEELTGPISITNEFYSLQADVLLGDGEALNIPGRHLTVVDTPGHTTGHICLADSSSGILFSGDHVLPTTHSGLGLGGLGSKNPVSEYLASLERLAAFDAYEVCPGHGFRFVGLAQRRQDLAQHHLRRSNETSVALAKNPTATVWEVAEQLSWGSGWHQLKGYHLQSAIAQTAMHLDHIRSSDGSYRRGNPAPLHAIFDPTAAAAR